jgi:hypothetical protein
MLILSALHLERMGALLVVTKLAAVALIDWQQFDHILVGIGLDISIQSFDLAVKLHQALSKNKGILCLLLVLDEQEDSLLGFLDVLLPQEQFSWVDRPSQVCCWVVGDWDHCIIMQE